MADDTAKRQRPPSPSQRLRVLEQARNQTLEALELAASIGIGESPRPLTTPAQVLADAARRMKTLLGLKSMAFFLIREPGGAFYMAKSCPPSRQGQLEHEMQQLVETGSAPWALQRGAPVFTTPSSGKGRLLLHALATPTRIRGLFLGVMGQEVKSIPDTSLKLATIILRGTAALLESVELYSLWRTANVQLKERVRELERSRRSLRREIDRRRAMEEQLKHQALHDPLTGLPNRTLIRDRILQAIRRAHRRARNKENAAFCVAFMDLDRFKLINDTLGHAAGDALLVETGRRIQTGLRELDTVARLGGDEFIILLEELPHPSEAIHVIKRVRTYLREPLELDGQTVSINASFGLAFGTDPQTTPETLLEQADAAMQAAKLAGRDRIRVFSKALGTVEKRQHSRLGRLRRALHSGRTTALFVPTFSTPGPRLRGFEAVPAWNDGPSMFHYGRGLWDLAAQAGMEWELWERTLCEALAQMAAWRKEPGCAHLAVTMHLGRTLAARSELAFAAAECLENHGQPGDALHLEVPEHALACEGAERLTLQLEKLKAIGVRLCVGQFGERFFTFLGQHPELIDSMRIDPSPGAEPCHANWSGRMDSLRALAASLGLDAVEQHVSREAVLGPEGLLGRSAVDSTLRPLTAQEALELIRRVRSSQEDGSLAF